MRGNTAKKCKKNFKKKGPSPEKMALIELSQRAKEIKKQAIAAAQTELEQFRALALTINDIVLTIYESKTGAKVWKTMKQWNADGFKIKKGEKAFYIWGAPREGKPNNARTPDANEDSEVSALEKYQYWPTCCLFNEYQVEGFETESTDSEDAEEVGPAELGATLEVDVADEVVNLDDNPFVCADYEGKQEAKRDRLFDRASKKQKEGENRLSTARQMGDAIPFGQPILVGHHSEKRDRAFRARMNSHYDKGFSLLNDAEAIETRASSVGSGGVASDDPLALEKLNNKLNTLTEKQQKMKAINAAVRTNNKNVLTNMGFNEQQIQEIFTPDHCGNIGIPGYALTNNSAEIRRLRKRIEDLKTLYTGEPIEHEDDNFRAYVGDGRIHIECHGGKPNEKVRNLLKGNGFKFSRYSSTWVRKATSNAMYSAQSVIKELSCVGNFY